MTGIVTNELYAEIDRLRARVKELEAERDADRRREYGYSQQTIDALTAERDALMIEMAEYRRQEILKQGEEIVKLKKRVMDLEADMRERGVAT